MPNAHIYWQSFHLLLHVWKAPQTAALYSENSSEPRLEELFRRVKPQLVPQVGHPHRTSLRTIQAMHPPTTSSILFMHVNYSSASFGINVNKGSSWIVSTLATQDVGQAWKVPKIMERNRCSEINLLHEAIHKYVQGGDLSEAQFARLTRVLHLFFFVGGVG